MQEILRTDPHYVDIASQQGRLYLVRTKGSLSGGTQVKVAHSSPDYSVLRVTGKIVVEVKTAPFRKTIDETVMVTLDDLVVRRMSQHPDALDTFKMRPRAVRRREQRASQKVLDQLKQREKNA